METFAQRWNAIQEKIEVCSQKRYCQKVNIVAISKKKPFSVIQEAYDVGVRHFGENYVQEALPKIQEAQDKTLHIQWHYVGALQTNKMNNIVPVVQYLHAIDQLSQIEKLEKQATGGLDLPKIFVQLNLANEDTKSGIIENEVPSFFEKVNLKLHVEIGGLMTFPPLQTDPEKNRAYFAKMLEWKERINGWKLDRIEIRELSMGVSSDYWVAVEEGATMVRLGEVLFGPRIP